jgi:CspA family cold shock protein
MSFIAKLLISLAVAAGAIALITLLTDGPITVYTLFAAIWAATFITALLVTLPGRPAAAAAPAKDTGTSPRQPVNPKAAPPPTADAARETGRVKWFNAAKGFGFIIKDDGEEIFVHFRSIRGEGRRGLRDGQKVSFVVAESDKGPQAEDVECID